GGGAAAPGCRPGAPGVGGGWRPAETSSGPPNASYWSRSASSDPLTPGQLIRRAWRLYRTQPRRLLAVAVIPTALQALLSIPTFITTTRLWQAMIDVMADVMARIAANPDAYRYPNTALQDELQDRFRAAMAVNGDMGLWS